MPPAPTTIFALSSGRPPAAIAVIRISGPRAAAALKTLIGRVPEPRYAAFARIRDPRTREIIDEALALYFPAPKSETGEDVVELQLHGGCAVIAATLDALGAIEDLRPAEAGEFTRRAFANGKLDLTAVEGLADLIAAETEAQRRQALAQMKGALGDRAEAWRRQLIEVLALVEAGIDFAEEDLPDDLMPRVRAKTQTLADEMAAVLDDRHRGERLRDGFVVAIAGPPNAGKSTLLNRIARREAAIVSPFPGTTRDVIEVHLDLGGYPVTLLDTAGIRDSADPVEMEGVNRARARAAAADLVLWVVDVTEPAQVSEPAPGERMWLIRNKIDVVNKGSLVAGRELAAWQGRGESGELKKRVAPATFEISAKEEIGLDSVLYALAGELEMIAPPQGSLITRARHRQALMDAHAALARSLAVRQEDLVAEELRIAARALGRLTGRIDVEDVLDVVFRDFCIGK